MNKNVFFKSLIDSSSEGIIISNSEGTIIFSNQKALDLFLYNEEELIGQKIEILIPRNSQKVHVGLRDSYLKKPISRPHGLGLDVFAIRKDNKSFPVEVSLSSFKDGENTFIVSLISDITKRKNKEQKIQKFITDQHEIKNAYIKSQLEVLKNQISPHYLFNCLSILNTLIDAEPIKAKLFTKKISETYGHVLETKNKKSVTLSSEISFLESYIYLQKIRFSNKFTLTIEEKLHENQMHILPLSIQILIENVFKHNELQNHKKLEISVRFKNNGIVVSNSIIKKKYKEKSFEIGLENLTNQYKLISKRIPKIEFDKNTFSVWLPLFKDPI